MAVTAKFVPERIDLLPNVPTTLTLRLYNGDAEVRGVTLTAAGDLVGFVTLDTTATTLETNQIVDVTLTVEVPSTVEAGTHDISVTAELAPFPVTAGGATPTDGDATPTDAEATPTDVVAAAAVPTEPGTLATIDPTVVIASMAVEVVAHSDYTSELRPSHSRGSSLGRHVLRILNTGNVTLALELSTDDVTDGVVADVADASIVVAPGARIDTPIRVTPNTTYWSGPTRTYDFVVNVASSDVRRDEHVGSYQQRPRVPNWLGPAAAGALAALVIGAIVWFAVLRPWVEDTSEHAAADAIEQDRVALQQRIDDLEAAALDAKELPLGTPTDLRLEVAPPGGNIDEATADIATGTRLSITDIVLENPTGAVGMVTLQRGDDVLLQSELANFRDFDRHFVAPFVFDDDDQIVLSVDCRTPGPGGSDCPVGASLLGFVDEAD